MPAWHLRLLASVGWLFHPRRETSPRREPQPSTHRVALRPLFGQSACRVGWPSGQPDQAIWEYDRRHDLAIVSKDNDFRQLSFFHGPPPKVVWLGIGNAGTQAIAHLLHQRRDLIVEFATNPEEGLLVLDLTSAGT